jgi:hypothetical protein
MPTCPACGVEVAEGSASCPRCHLDVALFPAILEAAGTSTPGDAAYVRTIGELLKTVDLAEPAAVPPAPTQGLLSRPARFPALRPPEIAASAPAPKLAEEPLSPLRNLPALPAPPTRVEVRRRVDDYFQLGRRLGLDFTEFERRANAARLVDDVVSLEVLAREMFVHVSSALAEEYDAALARRNELAQLVPTHGADVEFEAIRRAIATGDLVGAQRRLAHVRDELGQVEEEWQVGRILVTECELMAETVRELGGDPAPALGPLEEGRRLILRGRRADGERLLARAAVAMWSVLEARLFEDLRRLRDRMVEIRSAGGDVAPALADLRAVATELGQRNFVGTIVAYRRLRGFLNRAAPPTEDPFAAPVAADLKAVPPAGHV